jgi:hypothetical protein
MPKMQVRAHGSLGTAEHRRAWAIVDEKALAPPIWSQRTKDPRHTRQSASSMNESEPRHTINTATIVCRCDPHFSALPPRRRPAAAAFAHPEACFATATPIHTPPTCPTQRSPLAMQTRPFPAFSQRHACFSFRALFTHYHLRMTTIIFRCSPLQSRSSLHHLGPMASRPV